MRERKEHKYNSQLAAKILGLLFLLIGQSLFSQNQATLPDSGPLTIILTVENNDVEVGRPFRVGLEVHHPADMVVIFPDTTADFLPFELVKRYPVPTRSDETGSIDFVEYDLYSWGIDSAQYIQLPVKYIKGKDTLVAYSNEEGLQFIPRIATAIDSLQVIPNLDVAPVFEPVNWTAIFIIGLVLVVILIFIVLLFSAPILKAIRRRRIEREWNKYNSRLQKVPSLLPNQENYLLELAKVWKSYYDRGWENGLGSLSTNELKAVLPNLSKLESQDASKLLELNQNADRVVYAGYPVDDDRLKGYYQNVSRIMQQEYKRRKEAVEL